MIFFFRKCKGDDERPLRIIISTATPDNHSKTEVQRSNTPGYRTAILVGLIAAVLFFILCHSPNVLVEFLSLLARFFLKVCELYMKSIIIIIRILYNFFALFE